MANEQLPLGAWEQDRGEIEATALADRGDVADLPPQVKFQVHVARLIRKREQNPTAEFDLPAAFVLVSHESYVEFKATRTEHRLIHTGARRLTGRIHLLTDAAISSVVEEYGSDDNAMFQRLAAIGVANAPTLVYVPQKPISSLSFYPSGTATDSEVTDVSLRTVTVTAEQIEAVIHAVYEHELVTPDGTGPNKIWVNAAKGTPIDKAERFVQQLLRIGLAAKFASCSIRQEQPAKVGRTDLEIVDDRTGPPGMSVHHAVLELKVLRSRGETGVAVSETETQAHVAEGVDQAHSYGKDKNTKLRMLCCFDMRDKDGGDELTFEQIRTTAMKLSVLLRRWFLYRTSQLYRAAQTAAALRATP